MGKATGFMDYDRQDKPAEDPKERIKHFKEFHTPLSKEEQELQGSQMYGVRRTVLPVRSDADGNGKWLPAS